MLRLYHIVIVSNGNEQPSPVLSCAETDQPVADSDNLFPSSAEAEVGTDQDELEILMGAVPEDPRYLGIADLGLIYNNHLKYQTRSVCKGNTDIFYAPWDPINPTDEPKEHRIKREKAARKICATCPVLRECLIDFLSDASINEADDFIACGLSRDERLRMTARSVTSAQKTAFIEETIIRLKKEFADAT